MSQKYCACHEKVMPGHTKRCTCHAKIILANLRSDAPKRNPSPNISDDHVSCTAPATRNSSSRILFQMSHAYHRFLEMLANPLVCSLWARCGIPCACHAKRSFNVQSGANMSCFQHSDFEMCFAPQRPALFRHLNFQKWTEAGVLYTFWLRNVLRATTACTFSTSQLPRVLRTRQLQRVCLPNGQMAPHPPL